MKIRIFNDEAEPKAVFLGPAGAPHNPMNGLLVVHPGATYEFDLGNGGEVRPAPFSFLEAKV